MQAHEIVTRRPVGGTPQMPLRLPPVSGADADRPRLRLSLRLGTINPGPVRAALVAAGLDVEGPPSDAPAPAAGEREPLGD